tara:strand:- start:3662 stop:4297 length:636 start_codon:yes stop_codon:yes gene_type:complete
MEIDYVIKLVTIGEAGSGKTTLISCFCDQVKPNTYQPTIGVEFNVLYLNRGSKKYKLQFWDTAGQECFAPIVRSYYKNIAGVFYVIDLTCHKSIKKIDYWLKQFDTHKNCDSIMIIIGNKCDSNKRILSKEDMKQKFGEKNILYMETSALKNINTKLPLFKMIDSIVDNYNMDNHPGISNGTINNNKLRVKNRNSCAYIAANQENSCCSIS